MVTQIYEINTELGNVRQEYQRVLHVLRQEEQGQQMARVRKDRLSNEVLRFGDALDQSNTFRQEGLRRVTQTMEIERLESDAMNRMYVERIGVLEREGKRDMDWRVALEGDIEQMRADLANFRNLAQQISTAPCCGSR